LHYLSQLVYDNQPLYYTPHHSCSSSWCSLLRRCLYNIWKTHNLWVIFWQRCVMRFHLVNDQRWGRAMQSSQGRLTQGWVSITLVCNQTFAIRPFNNWDHIFRFNSPLAMLLLLMSLEGKDNMYHGLLFEFDLLPLSRW
jgi:hypothetical protein